MFAKFLFVVIAVAAIATGLLTLRQQRLEIANQMIVRHRQMDQTRRNLWDLQTAVAARVQPKALDNAIAKANLRLEPLVPMPDTSKTGKKSEAFASRARPGLGD